MEAELYNMCMITASPGRSLVQDCLPKPANPWSGLSFPSKHVEPSETVVASVIFEALRTVAWTDLSYTRIMSMSNAQVSAWLLGKEYQREDFRRAIDADLEAMRIGDFNFLRIGLKKRR